MYTPWYQRKLLWVFVLILILIPIGAWVYATYFMKSSSPPTQLPAQIQEKVIEEDKLPIAVDILQNPLVYEWRGSVEGVLVAKDEKYIILEKNNQEITILISSDPNGTKFFNIEGIPNKQKNNKNFIELVDIPIGTQLRGDFWIFPDRKNQLIGNVFEVVR